MRVARQKCEEVVVNLKGTGLRDLVAWSGAKAPLCLVVGCDEGERAHEVEDLGHGLFTAAMLEELKAKERAALPVAELVERVGSTMKDMTRERRLSDQTPWLSMSGAFPPLVGEGATGRRQAVCVGVNRVSDPNLAPCRFAEADAIAIADVLGDHGYETRVLVGERGTSTGLWETILEVREGTKPDDLVLLWFSGHGIETHQRHALVMQDARVVMEGVSAGLVFLDEVGEVMRRAACPVAVFVDSHFWPSKYQ